MANHKSAMKRHRQSLKRRARNKSILSRLLTERKKLETLTKEGDVAATEKQFRFLQKILNQAVAKGVIHRNVAARHLSRQSKKIAAAAS